MLKSVWYKITLFLVKDAFLIRECLLFILCWKIKRKLEEFRIGQHKVSEKLIIDYEPKDR